MTVRSLLATIGERVGGRFAVSAFAYLLSTPLMVASFVATEWSALGDWSEFWLIVATALAGHAALGVVFWLAAISVLRGRRTRPASLWTVIGVYLVGAWARWAVLVWFLERWAIGDETPLWLRLFTSSLLIPLCYGFAAYSLESLARYRKTRDALIASIVRAEVQLDRQQGAIESLRDAYLLGVERDISEANRVAARELTELKQRIAAGVDARPELRALLDRADSSWRALSHQALVTAKISVPPLHVREFIDTLVASKPLSGLVVTTSAMFLFLIGFARSLPLGEAFAWSGLWWVVMGALGQVSNTLGATGRAWSAPAILGGYLAMLAAGAGFVWIPGLDEPGVLGAVAIHLVAVLLIPIVGMGPAIVKSQDAVLTALRKHLDRQTISRLKVESELAVLARKIANRLHARTRGIFLAQVLRLQKSLDSGELDAALTLIEKIRETLLDPSVEGDRVERESADVVGFLENWRGLVDIDSNLHTAKIPAEISPAVATIVMNAVNDAVRHGGADWVNVDFAQRGTDYTITVVNNGKASDPRDPPGLGDETLSELATGGWSRESDVMGFTRLSATLSVTASRR